MDKLLTLALLTMTSLPAWADGATAIVVPNRPDVPVIINGVDASWAVIEGDWGLARGVHVQPTIYGGRVVDFAPHVGHYFPTAGKMPGYGRLEIDVPTRPRRAESYFRSYAAQSAPPRAQDQDAPQMVLEVPYGAASLPPRPSVRRRGY